MEAVLRKDAMTENFTDVQSLINETVGHFCYRYGGDFEEWQAAAYLAFVQSCDTYKEKHGRFRTWVCWCVWKDLLTYTRKLYRQLPGHIASNQDILKHFECKKTSSSFSIIEIVDEANEDAKLLINLIWEPPPEIIEANIKNGNHPCHMKMMLKTYLFKIGWTGARIKETFAEIERILYV